MPFYYRRIYYSGMKKRLKYTLSRDAVESFAEKPGVYTFWLDLRTGLAAKAEPCIREERFRGSLSDLYGAARLRGRRHRLIRLTLHDGTLFVDDDSGHSISLSELIGRPAKFASRQ